MKYFDMEAVMAAVASDLVSRVISFVIKKYTDKIANEDKLQRLQQLLLRIHAVVEEADRRYITNPRMLMQLKLLVGSMYRGYHTLDTFRYRFLMESFTLDDESTASYSFSPLKRSRRIPGTVRSIYDYCSNDDLESVLDDLECAVSSMTEFVVLLGGCERIWRRPYDTYLYTDNFLFGRHVEKQQIINSLLMDPPEAHGAPTVIPVIGGIRVGKKTLISHVCMNDRIRSKFPSIIFISGNSIHQELENNVCFSIDRTLVVIEFVTDVKDDDWERFYSHVKRKAPEGSKLVIYSRIQNLARFGTVKAVYLNKFTIEEYRYLFKMLAFGCADEQEHPQLASLANKLATVLGGSLVTANAVANLLRQNLDLQFWLYILRRFKTMVDYNISKYGVHPKDMLEQGRPIDITTFIGPSYSASLRVVSPDVETTGMRSDQAQVTLGDLISGRTSLPSDELLLVAWESRVPPYTKYVCATAVCADQRKECTRKRPFNN